MGRGNTSTAVMASTSPISQAMSALNFFPTPPWATRALLEEVLLRQAIPLGVAAWEPCCGAGHMAIPLAEHFGFVFATDVHDWGFGAVRDLDFSFCGPEDAPRPIDWVFANPPFQLAETFLERGLRIARKGVALLLRLQWLEGGDRYYAIYSTPRRPHLLCPFAERVPMIEGCWDPEASSATAYAWFVFLVGGQVEFDHYRRTEIVHIPPGMALRHTRSADAVLANPGEAERRRLARKAGG